MVALDLHGGEKDNDGGPGAHLKHEPTEKFPSFLFPPFWARRFAAYVHATRRPTALEESRPARHWKAIHV
jgi:hypothetical protein